MENAINPRAISNIVNGNEKLGSSMTQTALEYWNYWAKNESYYNFSVTRFGKHNHKKWPWLNLLVMWCWMTDNKAGMAKWQVAVSMFNLKYMDPTNSSRSCSNSWAILWHSRCGAAFVKWILILTKSKKKLPWIHNADYCTNVRAECLFNVIMMLTFQMSAVGLTLGAAAYLQLRFLN